MGRDYEAEVYAFGYRIGSPTLNHDDVVRAVTSESFYSRADVMADSSGAQPSKEDSIISTQHNTQLIPVGERKLMDVLCGYLRYSLPSAPEELINAVASTLSADDTLASLGTHLGLDCLVRTAEFPPSPESVSGAFKALLAAMEAKRAEALIVDVVIPQLLDVDFMEVFALREPLAVLTDILHAKGYSEIEPRLQRSAGVVSAEPIYLVGIYADQQMVGKSAGESISIAVDMAARDSLLREWGLSIDRSLPFGDRAHSIDFALHHKPNKSLKNICKQSTDLSLLDKEGSEDDVLNVVDVAQRYKDKIEPVVGRSLTRRLRHKFSRGSLAKRSFRHMVKPGVQSVC